MCGPGSSVGIVTDYGLDGPGSNPGGDEIFRPSRSTLGPLLIFPLSSGTEKSHWRLDPVNRRGARFHSFQV